MSHLPLVALIFFASPLSHAEDRWCYPEGDILPCNGAPGKCTRNADNSEGGFVADGVNVPLKLTIRGYRNKAKIHQTAQICGGRIGKRAIIGEGVVIRSGYSIGIEAVIG